MGRRKYQFTEAKVRKYLAEGRGTGDGANYKPWLTVYDLPSRGRSHRIYGIKTGRVHHLLSDGEWKSFLRFEFDDSVLDIREQFPLDRRQTMRVARDLGYAHPITTDGTPYVMTIDFLRVPAHDGQDSEPMADTIPAAWRTVFRPDRGHFGGRSGTLSAMISERCPRSPARDR